MRILAAVDFRDGKIIRWVDYWDAAPYDEQLYAKFRTPDAHFPRDLKDTEVPTQAAPELVTATTALQHAFAAGDAPAAADLLHTLLTFRLPNPDAYAYAASLPRDGLSGIIPGGMALDFE